MNLKQLTKVSDIDYHPDQWIYSRIEVNFNFVQDIKEIYYLGNLITQIVFENKDTVLVAETKKEIEEEVANDKRLNTTGN